MKFLQVIDEFRNKPYAPGGYGPNAYDCIGLVYAYAKRIGKPLPDVMGKYTLDNYAQVYDEDVLTAYNVMADYFNQNCEKLLIGHIIAGDIILTRQAEGGYFTAIYAGNGNLITSFIGDRVRVLSLDKLHHEIMGAWRLR